MHSSVVFLLALLAISVNAHFQLQFPAPRGVFVEDDEPNFCDGYLTPSTNRTEFPLSGGFFTLNSEHPSWTAGVLLSTAADPTSFNNFSQINNFFQVKGEGGFCIPLDFKTSNATGLKTGDNVTVQIVFDGGDGQLYQCADLTLSDNFTISSSIACTNATGSSSTSSSGTPTAPGGSNPTTKSFAVAKFSSPTAAIVGTILAVFGMVVMI
ncbi:hypothetical protein GALMADRAFT_217823 [Galerina marginata CBS 339.88]|uniref:Copper acquisition factor BIM1-like domain-containing protein n=1 Tax=Galerina marginata (strain CBS 339.88) TaxID=685588 RepID=A0A067TXN9_GALM3|nr:hypothetical protein GALMADRAFT_217823 [Galerina marginata CBS 339.88]